MNNYIDSEISKAAAKFWSYIEERAERRPADICFHSEKKQAFITMYESEYERIIQTYMDSGTKNLDAHKTAALFIIQLLKSNIFTESVEKYKEGEINIFSQAVAVDIAFEFMLICLNERLEEKDIPLKVKGYILPIPYSCNREYKEVMYRILFFEGMENEDMSYNLFELSDRLFMIEYLTLLQNGIEPSRLKEVDEDVTPE